MKLLFIITSGIGNVVMMTPMFQAVKELYPDSKITLLSSAGRKEGKIVEGSKFVDKCLYSSSPISPEKFDYMILSPLYGNEFNDIINQFPANKIIPIDCGKQINWKLEHEVEVNMRIARFWGFTGDTPETKIATKKPSKVTRFARKRMKIGMHTGCENHPDFRNKLWEDHRWSRVAIELERDYGAQIIWFGAGNDFGFDSPTQINLINAYKDIRETAYMMKKCDLFISLDSGLMHIANALKIPTVALFGPTLLTKNRPWNEGSEIISNGQAQCKNWPCYFSPLFKSCKDNVCLSKTTPEDVLGAVQKIIKKVEDKPLKVYLLASGQLGNTLNRAINSIPNTTCVYYDYREVGYDFSGEANDYNLVIVLKGLRGVKLPFLAKVTTKKVLLFNDNVCRYQEEFDVFKPYFDHIFTFNDDQEHGCKHLPFAIDDTKDCMDIEKTIDVSFIGNTHCHGREKWYREVQRASEKLGIKVSVSHDLPNDQYVRMINASKITINHHFNTAGPNMRFFEAMAAKSLMITDEITGVPKDMMNGVHFRCYDSGQDLMRICKYYLEHEDKRKEITDRAYKLVMKKHKYSDRMIELFRRIGLR